MTRDSVLLLLMVVAHFLLLSKVMLETFFKKFQLNSQKSTEEVVSRLIDLQDSEKRRDIIMLQELPNSPFKTLSQMIDQTLRVL
jgi:hypothetical protein